jgi:hypothetical protein
VPFVRRSLRSARSTRRTGRYSACATRSRRSGSCS